MAISVKIKKGSSTGLPFLFLWFMALTVLITPDYAGAQDGKAAGSPINAAKLSEDEQGRFVVDAFIGEKGPFPFIIDTAASRTVAYRRLPVALGIEALPWKSKRVYTATGRTDALLYPIEDIAALGTSIHIGQMVAIADPPGRKDAYGLIGIDLLRGKTLAFYLRQAKVQLFDNLRDLPAYESWTMTQGRPVGYGSLAITLEIEGVKIPAIIDTGASFSVLTSVGYRALPSSKNAPKKKNSERLRRIFSSAGVSSAGHIVDVGRMKVGAVEYEQVELLVSDLPVFAAFGASRVPAIIIGTDILGRGEFALDFNNWRLYQR